MGVVIIIFINWLVCFFDLGLGYFLFCNCKDWLEWIFAGILILIILLGVGILIEVFNIVLLGVIGIL